jgi:hypothetical protein
LYNEGVVGGGAGGGRGLGDYLYFVLLLHFSFMIVYFMENLFQFYLVCCLTWIELFVFYI